MFIRHQGKRAKVPTASTARNGIERKTCKTLYFQAVDKRAVFVVAVDTLLSAGDSRIEYRPQECPANHYITGDAGDAVGTLRGLCNT